MNGQVSEALVTIYRSKDLHCIHMYVDSAAHDAECQVYVLKKVVEHYSEQWYEWQIFAFLQRAVCYFNS